MVKKGGGNVDDIDNVVLKDMESKNRPFSVNDICMNLRDAYGKTALQKSVDKLVQDGKLLEKVYGKQKIYLIDQSGFPELSPADSQALDAKIEEVQNNLKQVEVEVKEMEGRVKNLQSAKSNAELQQQLKELTKEVAEMETKYTSVSSKAVSMDKGKRKQQKKARELYLSEWRGRKRKCMDILNTVLDNYPSTKKELFEEIGVETDEDVGVQVPPL